MLDELESTNSEHQQNLQLDSSILGYYQDEGASLTQSLLDELASCKQKNDKEQVPQKKKQENMQKVIRKLFTYTLATKRW